MPPKKPQRLLASVRRTQTKTCVSERAGPGIAEIVRDVGARRVPLVPGRSVQRRTDHLDRIQGRFASRAVREKATPRGRGG